MKLLQFYVDDLIKRAITEDINYIDSTTDLLIDEDDISEAYFVSKADGVLAGIDVAMRVFTMLDDTIEMNIHFADGDEIKKGDVIAVPNDTTNEARALLLLQDNGLIKLKDGAGLTATVAKTSAGALNYTPVAKVTNLVRTMEELKEKGLWFVCADMGGTTMYDLNLKGPIGLVIGNEGEGVSRLVRENCDFVASIPMKGDIDSLNASVAAGVLAYEIVRQRMQ